MAKNDNLKDFLKDIADAIREVQGVTGPINPQDFSNIIRGFSSGSSGLTFPVYLYTEELGSDFRRRESDELAVSVLAWYDNNRVESSDKSHHMPADVLAGKLYIDDSEVTAIEYRPLEARDVLFFESAETYGMANPWKIIQYTATTSVAKGTIDVLENG